MNRYLDSVKISPHVRLLCGWSRHLTRLPLPLRGLVWWVQVAAWLKDRKSLRCLLVAACWQKPCYFFPRSYLKPKVCSSNPVSCTSTQTFGGLSLLQ